MLQDCFLSIVDPEARKKSNGVSPATVETPSPKLLVRARRRMDIERFMGALLNTVVIEATPNRDYQFRALVKREIVANLLLNRVMTINYGNFKGGSKDCALHYAYMGVWTAMDRGLSPRSYGARARDQGESFDDLMPGAFPDLDHDGFTKPMRIKPPAAKRKAPKMKGR